MGEEWRGEWERRVGGEWMGEQRRGKENGGEWRGVGEGDNSSSGSSNK